MGHDQKTQLSVGSNKNLIQLERYGITSTALMTAAALGFNHDSIVDAVLKLKEEYFYKSMESTELSGLWQDVYHAEYGGLHLYVKLQITGREYIKKQAN